MAKLIYYSILFVFTLNLIGCNPPESLDSTEEAKAAIEASNTKWMEAFEKGDAAAIADLYTEDAEFLPANKATIKGRKNIQNEFQGVIDAGILVKLEVVTVEAQGNLAYEVGNALVQTANGQIVDNSKYIVVWKKVGDSWKMYKDIYNSSNPIPQSEPEE